MIISPVEQPRPTIRTFLIAETIAILASSFWLLPSAVNWGYSYNTKKSYAVGKPRLAQNSNPQQSQVANSFRYFLELSHLTYAGRVAGCKSCW
jgi:hypothetical protein